MAKINFQNMNSMVGQDAVFQGDIKLDEGIIVYGTVYGNIQSKGAVRVSRTGKVHGNISVMWKAMLSWKTGLSSAKLHF
jgi:cytoskeletal protein CcmA (bactofilin family)